MEPPVSLAARRKADAVRTSCDQLQNVALACTFRADDADETRVLGNVDADVLEVSPVINDDLANSHAVANMPTRPPTAQDQMPWPRATC